MRTVCLAIVLLNATIASLSEQPPVQASYFYDVARTHEIQPHRRTIPMEGVSHEFNQLCLKLLISPSGDVVDATATGAPWNMEFWPKLREEVLGWKFKPFEKDGKAVTAEVEEFLDLVPPERLPAKHVVPPVLRPDSEITITLIRSGCFGSCPAYRVTVDKDETVFEGRAFVFVPGRHTSKVEPGKVQELAQKFIASDFYSMDPIYRAHVTDLPTYVLRIAIDGQEKSVEDYAGREVGMPDVVTELEKEVDNLAQTQRWIKGSDGFVANLKEEKYDFATFDAQVMLKMAAERGDTVIVAQLVKAGVPLGVALPAPPGTILMSVRFQRVGWLAAAAAHADTLRVLITAGASRNDQNDKNTALVAAAKAGQLDSVKALIADGADPNVDASTLTLMENTGGLTLQYKAAGNVLFYAAESGKPELVKEILRYHPDVNARGANGHTPIFGAGERRADDMPGARVAIVRLLVRAGAKVDIRDDDGNTPLHDTSQIDVMEQLLAMGANVNAQNKQGETPIFTTMDGRAIPLLVRHGADLTIRNNKGQTVLEAAGQKGPLRQQALREALEKAQRP